MMQIANDHQYYGRYYIRTHAVEAARKRFPKFCAGLNDAQIRQQLDEHISVAEQNGEWLPARKSGEFVVQIPTQEEGIMCPVLSPSEVPRCAYAVVSILTEQMRVSWRRESPELPSPKLFLRYRLKQGEERYCELKSETEIADRAMTALEEGASRDSIEVYRQVPYVIVGKTKR